MTDSRLAVFDLDGTITRRDTFLPYVRGWLAQRSRRLPLGVLAAAARFLAAGRDRGRLKSDILRLCMGGATRHAVREWTVEFVAGLGERDFCPGAFSAIADHQAAGDRLVLLSASVDLYVPAIGERFGFTETICTEVRWQGDALDGALVTENRRGEEKLRCIEALRRRFPGASIAAYGNSGSDLPHLAAVERPLLVNAGAAARQKAEKMGIPSADWRNKTG
jgi:HAD superfamily hydrolase (TIGR01490 family)